MRLGLTGGLATQDAHGRYHDAVERGNCYFGCMPAVAAFGTALTATMVTLALHNPVGSRVGLSLLEVGVFVTVVTSAGPIFLCVNDNTAAAVPATVTERAPRNVRLDGSAGVGKLYTAATLPAVPTAVQVLAAVCGTTAQDIQGAGEHVIDMGGKILLLPNTTVCVQGLTTNAQGVAHFVWEEVPLP